uniref:Uncharacterized protein n=1 Tax=Triticum urartu TaxID=4572 RepID=A0A8R7P7W1_TRIUA
MCIKHDVPSGLHYHSSFPQLTQSLCHVQLHHFPLDFICCHHNIASLE